MNESTAVEITASINTGEIFKLNRKKLEHFILSLSTANAYSYFGASEFPNICQTVRMALSERINEDSIAQANRQSKTALHISVFALICGILQVAIALWQIYRNQPIQVFASEGNPVHVLYHGQLKQQQEVKLKAPDTQPPEKSSLPNTTVGLESSNETDRSEIGKENVDTIEDKK